jgi:hypothetical protein
MSEEKELDREMNANMNPRVRVVDVGTRTLRKITLYPLSLSDQLKLKEIVIHNIQLYLAQTDTEFSPKAVVAMAELVQENLPKVLAILFPDENVEKLISELDNHQLSKIIEFVYEDNYRGPAKNLSSLFNPATNASGMERLSQLSAGSMGIELNTSSDSATKMEG